MRFKVFTVDGRVTEFEEQPSSTFIVMWKAALTDPEKQWPFGYLSEIVPAEITADTEVGPNWVRPMMVKKSAVHFAPHAIVAVAVDQ